MEPGAEASGGVSQETRVGGYYALLLLILVGSASICIWLFGAYTGDSARYLRLAGNLAHGHGFSAAEQPPYYPEVFRPPMYPLWLAGLMGLGLGTSGILAAQVVLYLLSVIMVVGLARSITGNQLAAKSLGFLLASYLPLVHWVTSITTESLCTMLFCVSCWSLVRHLERPSWSNTTMLGLSVAALFLTRFSYVVLVPLIIGISLSRLGRRAVKYSFVLTIVIAVPVGGWVIRNVTAMPGSFNPLGVNSGIALWARSVELREPSIAGRAEIMNRDRDFQIVHGNADPRLQVDADQRLRSRGVDVIRADLIGFLRLTVWAMAYREWVEGYDPRLPVALLWVATGWSTLLLALGYAGIGWAGKKRLRVSMPLVVLCFGIAASHAPFVIEARHTAAVRPVLYMFSALAFAKTVEWVLRCWGSQVEELSA